MINIKTNILVVLVTFAFSAQATLEEYLALMTTSSKCDSRLSMIAQYRKEILKLIDKTLDLSYLTSNSPLLKIVKYEELVDFVELMLKHKANPNVHATLLYTPIHIAVIHGNYEAICVLLRFGAHPNEKNKLEETPLHTALKQDLFCTGLRENRVAIVKLLLQHGANQLAQSKDQENALAIEYKRALEVDFFVLFFDQLVLSEPTKKSEAQNYKKIAQLLIAYIGLYSKQGRIAREGLAQVLLPEIVCHIASYLPEYDFHYTNTQVKQQD